METKGKPEAFCIPDGKAAEVFAGSRKTLITGTGWKLSTQQTATALRRGIKVDTLNRRRREKRLEQGSKSRELMPTMDMIIFEKTENFARIVLNRPPANVMNIEMMTEVNKFLEGLSNQDHIKIIIFGSSGRFFSAGVDMADHAPQKVFELLEAFHGIFLNLRELARPTIAVVNGPALGAGCELATFCDLVIASENAKFGQPEIRVGVFPPIAAAVFPSLMGKKKTMELILTGDSIGAQEALELGFVNRVVPQDKLEATLDEFVSRIIANSGSVLQMTKMALVAGEGLNFQDALKKVQDIYLNHLMPLEDTKEGLTAFLERRTPTWKDK
jgi:cyclohexa-1,5-dienecarbonyl-CoA hydratase